MQYFIKLLLVILFFLYGNKYSETNDTTNNKNTIEIINKNLELFDKKGALENDSVLSIAKNTLELSDKVNYPKGLYLSYYYIANYYRVKNLHDSAIHYYHEGIPNIENDYYTLSGYYWNLANLYRVTGNYSTALEYSLKCKELIEDKKSNRFTYQIYNLLALSYQTLMEYDLALINYEKSAKLAIEKGNEAYAGVIYANIGKLYYEQDSLGKALEYFEKGIMLEEKHGLIRSAGNSYTVVGKIYLKLHLLDSARFYLEKASDYNRKSDNKIGLSNTLVSISEYYYLMNDFESAELHLNLTIKHAQKLNSRSILKEAYLLKSKLNAKQNDFEQAYLNFEKFYNIHSAMYDVEKINQAKALEQKLLQQERENELVELELEQQRTINTLLILLITIGILVGIIILFYLFRFRRLSKELKKSKEKAEESDKLKSRFLQTISHEIRTPLNGIVGFSEMIRTKGISEEEMNQINDMINKNSDDLISTIENLVDIAHLSTNQIELKKSKFQLVPLLENIIKVSEENVAYKNKNNLCLELKKSSEIELETDKNIIKKILIHLIKNAIQYTESGSIVLGYKKENSNLVVFVKDTGIGISKEKIDLIFSPFQQADENINIKVGGTGLGLTIVNGLIHKLGGEVWVGSELKKGSTFYISLPLN